MDLEASWPARLIADPGVGGWLRRKKLQEIRIYHHPLPSTKQRPLDTSKTACSYKLFRLVVTCTVYLSSLKGKGAGEQKFSPLSFLFSSLAQVPEFRTMSGQQTGGLVYRETMYGQTSRDGVSLLFRLFFLSSWFAYADISRLRARRLVRVRSSSGGSSSSSKATSKSLADDDRDEHGMRRGLEDIASTNLFCAEAEGQEKRCPRDTDELIERREDCFLPFFSSSSSSTQGEGRPPRGLLVFLLEPGKNKEISEGRTSQKEERPKEGGGRDGG
ncbi:hypothetical protein TRV_06718 [Trichophyton verrucosum HKI 0517]|uniref:Uncharacterized protein n=1 Tax=Trichophyton verrucosum (strain HKI 0517) TaxID=663202 RepID=D4DHR1_TRIVH|nr:uncharacterized protein TRV_06718 [Trichophyton verrucosum HKI 0517]EFE38610.1 hypothetical protein TRV_06718 [Trichophyton verrucosum HKI 0517]